MPDFHFMSSSIKMDHDVVPDSVGINQVTSSEVYKIFTVSASSLYPTIGAKVYKDSRNRHLRKPQLISDDTRNRLEFIANDQDHHPKKKTKSPEIIR